MLCHHMVVLSHTHLNLCSRRLAELIAVGLEHGLVNLPIILDDVNGDAILVGKLGEPHCALVQPHDTAAALKCFDKRCDGGGRHLETFALSKLLASFVCRCSDSTCLSSQSNPSSW